MSKFIIALFVIWGLISNILPLFEISAIYRFWQVVIVLIFFCGVVICYSKYRIFKNKTILLLFFWLLYVNFVNIITLADSPYNFIDIFIDTNWWVFIFILFFSIFLNDYEDYYLKKLIKFFPVFFFLSFILVSYKMIFFFGTISQGVIEQNDINSVFWVFLLIPFVFLTKNRFLKYLILSFALILIIVSSKRSAILAISVIFIFLMYIEIFNKQDFIKNLFKGFILIIISYLLFVFTISKVDVNVMDRFKETNLDEEARFDFVSESWEIYINKPLFNILCGSGHRSSGFDRGSDLLSKTTHNDFFEVLYNYGVFGLVLYFFIIFRIFLRFIYIKRYSENLFNSLIVTALIFFVISMVSHLIIYPTYFSYIVILWSISEAIIYRNNLSNLNVFNTNKTL